MRFSLRQVEAVLLMVIILLAAFLRISCSSDNPGWYTDEATHIDIARHLLNGQIQYMAVQDSTLLFARPPLFHVALAALLRMLPGVEAITTLRLFTGLLGVLSCVLLYALARRTGDGLFALLTALMLAVHPLAVLYSRFGFSYNLAALLLLASLGGLWAYLETQRRMWLVVSALALGFGAITDLIVFTFMLPYALVLGRYRLRDLLWGMPLACLPFALYVLVMLIQSPDAFFFDLRFTFSRLSPSLGQQIRALTNNLTVLMGDGWMLLGVLGLFLIQPTQLRWMTLLFFWLPLVNIGRTVALYSLSTYYLIPLLPFVALGIAALIVRAVRLVIGFRPMRRHSAFVMGIAGALLLILAGPPLYRSTANLFDQIQNGFVTPIDSFLINPADARRAAAYINQHADQGDSVIVSPPLAWLIQTHVVDFQMMIAATGQTTPHLPGNLPLSRYGYDPSLDGARYIVVDDLWRRWGVVHVSGLAEVLRLVEGWPLVFQSGAITVYENQSNQLRQMTDASNVVYR